MFLTAADASGKVSLWGRSDNLTAKWILLDQVSLTPTQIANAIKILPVPEDSILLVMGCLDCRLHLYLIAMKDIVPIILADLDEPSIDRTTTSLFSHSGVLSGHEEWVTCLACQWIQTEEGIVEKREKSEEEEESKTGCKRWLLLASASQDCKIRLWKLVPGWLSQGGGLIEETVVAHDEGEEDNDEGEELEDASEMGTQSGARRAGTDPTLADADMDEECRLLLLSSSCRRGEPGTVLRCYLESLLVGHEDWVTAVAFLPPAKTPFQRSSSVLPQLLSTSMDRNMVIWAVDEGIGGGLWCPVVRVGDLGGALGGSIGGNLLGFVGGCTSPDGKSLLGVGYGGSFHMWKQVAKQPLEDGTENEDISGGIGVGNDWRPLTFLSGHFGPVNDVTWASDDSLSIYSVSADQTCRLFAALSFTGRLGGHNGNPSYCNLTQIQPNRSGLG